MPPIPIFKKLTNTITETAVADLGDISAQHIQDINSAATAVTDAAASVASDLLSVREAAIISRTGDEDTKIYGVSNGTASLSSSYARWARFRDAGSTLSETTIPVGTIVNGITALLTMLSTSAKVRGRVWRRALTSSSLNSAPGAVGDELTFDSGIVPMSAEALSMAGLSGVFLTVPCPKFEIIQGYAYGFDFQVFDATDTLITATMGYITTSTLAARHSGFHYASTAAVAFSTNNTTRPMRIGYTSATPTTNLAKLNQKANGKIFATANSSKLSDLERKVIVRQGAWTGPDKIMRPTFPTFRMGLARLGLSDGTYGVDFGPRINVEDMAEMATIPGINTATAGQYRFLFNTTNTPKGAVYSGYKQIAGRSIYVPTSNWARLFLSDCYMDGQAVVGMPITMQQVTNGSITKLPYVEIEHCDFRRYGAGMGNIYNGAIRKSLILHSGANGLQIQQDYTNGSHLTLEQNLFCYVGTADAGADPLSHSDVLEMNRSNGLSAVGNVYYLPSSGTTYDPGQYGTTNCIRHSSDGSSPISNIYHLAELVIGGNSTVGMHMRHNLTVSNILYAFSRFSTNDYVIYNNYIELRGPNLNGYTVDWCNLAFFDLYRTDGTPMALGDGTGWTQYNAIPKSYYERLANPYRPFEEKWGVFNWDKSRATPKFIESLQLLGYSTGRNILDSNNDLNPEYSLGALKTVL